MITMQQAGMIEGQGRDAQQDIIKDLREQLSAHKEVLGMCREIIEGCINNQPASEGGGMYYERFDGDGNYSGAEHVDPAAIYQATLDELHKVLAAIAKLKDVHAK